MARSRRFRLAFAACALCVAAGGRPTAIDVLEDDGYAETVVALRAPGGPSLGISAPEHDKIAAILSRTRRIVATAEGLAKSGDKSEEATEMLTLANSVFSEVKDHIHRINAKLRDEREGGQMDSLKKMLRGKFSDHDLQRAREDDARLLDVTRNMYQTMINFPECLERFFRDCLAIINRELASLGLTTLEVVVHEKRRPDDEGYNNVVIITNELADRVAGQAGDGIVTYPYPWHEHGGERVIGVDGKWNCHGFTPEQCCQTIKEGVPHPDRHGNYIECHIFVPFGGTGNPKRNDRVIINLSPDGRVHEAPIIQ